MHLLTSFYCATSLVGRFHRLFALLALLLLSLFLLPERITHSSAEPSDSPMPTLAGDKAIEHLKQQGSYQSLQEAIAAVNYEAKWQPKPLLAGVGAAQQLSNRANNLLAYVTAEGLEVTSLDGEEKSWRLGLKLIGIGYGANLSAVSSGAVSATGSRVEIKRNNGLTEWFVNSSRGIEQGFTLASRPIRNQPTDDLLRLRLAVSGDLRTTVNEAGSAATFIRETDNVLVSYDKLFVTDAKGRVIEARLRSEGSELVIEVEDGKAEYPLTIDPLLRELQRLTASDGEALDRFGFSVAISGDTAVIGAPGVNSFQGSAYVFVRSGPTWSQQQKLIASDGAANDGFGGSVAISGDTVVVGAQNNDVGTSTAQGSAYVFFRSGTTWTQQAKLIANDGEANDRFGNTVAISGDTVIVGALSQHPVYVFVRSGSGWIQQATLFPSDPTESFGWSIAISGDTVVVGTPFDDIGDAFNQGAAYVFVRSGTLWSQQQKLIATDSSEVFQSGWSVAISGNTIVIGANGTDVGVNSGQGSAYVFVRNGTVWSQQQILTASDGAAGDAFGGSVTISGVTIAVGQGFGTGGLGFTYVFVRNGTIWSQQQKLIASDGEAGDGFGRSIAVSEDKVIVGARFDDVGANTDQGSAYLFVCNWDQQAKLIASDGALSDQFGNAVAISGDTVVVGARFDDVGSSPPGPNRGSAYVFFRRGTLWSEQQRLTASDGIAGDQFGNAVSISGNTIVVGDSLDDVGGNTNQGSAYVFVRNGTVWSQQQILTAPDGAANDNFGNAVSISGETLIVSANTDDVGANTDQGSAYVFVRSGTTWTQQQKLTASDGASSDQFGAAVSISISISGERLVVGANTDDVGANADQGSAYLFVRSGTSWTEQAKLIANDGAAGDQFGIAVSIDVDSVIVGAQFGDVGANADQGSAYLFVRSGASWSQQQKVISSDGAAGDQFGNAVAISFDSIVVGAWTDTFGVNNDQGSAYVFMRSGTTWTERQKLSESPGGMTNDRFGSSVAIFGNTVIVGAHLDNAVSTDDGSAFIFYFGCNTSPTMLVVSGVTRQQGSPATVDTVATVFDSEDPLGYLTVSVASAPAGISFTNFTNNNGNISAAISASCTAPLGTSTVILQVTDTDGAVGSVQLLVTVTANSLPTLGAYNDTAVAVSGSTTVTPNAPPADNGSIVQFGLSAPTFAGNLGFNPANGAVTVSNARPGGNHVVTITATDNCGAIFSSAFFLTVNCLNITVSPASIPAGTAGSAYNQVFTQTGGNGAITFSLSGALPTGLSFTGATLSGTPTQVGSFPVTVTATDQTNCSGSRNYTLIINAPLLVWTGSTSSDWHTAANWTPNAIPTPFHDVSIPSSGVLNQPVIASASSSINAMTLQAGRVLTINSSRQLATAGNITSGGQITGAGSLLFDGATFTQNGSVSVASVEFDAGTHALTGGGSFASGIITVLGGASVALTSNHSVSVVVINGGGSFDITNRSLTLTGAGTAIFNSGSVNATGSTVIYQGTVSQVVTANIGYNNLTVNNPAGVSLAGDTTVNGLLDLQTDLTTGTFTLTMPASGSSSGEGDVIGKVKRTGFVSGGTALSFGNPMNRVRIDTGAAPTDITVELVNLPPFGYSNTVRRSYTITAHGGSGIEATLRLRYKDADASGLDETAFELWRQAEAGWQTPTGTAIRDTAENWVEESGITEFSVWTISGGAGPICGVLSPISQYFGTAGSEGRVIVTALANCSWASGANVSWIEVMSSPSGTGTEVVSYIVRDNLTSMPRVGTMTIAGQTFTVVQASASQTECEVAISPAFTTYGASGGAGSVSITTDQQCAWEAVSDSSWITITSVSCGIDNGTITYSVAANPGVTGRAAKIRVGGKVLAIKQKGP